MRFPPDQDVLISEIHIAGAAGAGVSGTDRSAASSPMVGTSRDVSLHRASAPTCAPAESGAAPEWVGRATSSRWSASTWKSIRHPPAGLHLGGKLDRQREDTVRWELEPAAVALWSASATADSQPFRSSPRATGAGAASWDGFRPSWKAARPWKRARRLSKGGALPAGRQ